MLRKLDRAEWGGTETALERLFEGLRQNDIEAVVYSPRLPGPAEREAPEIRRFRAFVPIAGLSARRRRQLLSVGGNLMSFDLPGLLWRERDAAIMHTHTLGRIGGIARLVARRRRIPFVVSIHGGVLDLPQNVRREFNAPRRTGWEWGRIFGWLLGARLLFRDADCIITCNETEAALLRKSHPNNRIVVQPHGVPLSQYQADCKAAARAAFPQIAGRPMLLCVGRIDPIKNQSWLLEQAPALFQRHPKAVMVLAGPCTDEPYGELIGRKIEELGLKGRVLLTGGMPSNDPRLIGLMQEAGAVLLPSLSETFGLVILEAWAAGAVVISSRASGPRALIREGENGWLFGLDDPAPFHAAVDRALFDPAEARRMARDGASVSEQHSLAALAGRLGKLYEELIREKQCAT
ncbi:MAG TPA: glycosyltransferase family 4 protein [Verrucomicrobiae bacterium]